MSHYGDDPGQGNLRAISRFADVQRSRSDSLGTVKHDLIVLVNSVLERAWIGDTADAWKFRVRRQYPSIETAADLARHWASAADSYHASVERLHRRAQAANEEIWNATQVLNGLSHVPTEYMTPATQAQIQHYEDQRYSAYGKLNTLAIEREHVDATFAAALRNHTSAGEATNWTALSQLYAGAATAADVVKARDRLLAENLDRVHKIITTGALDGETEDLTSFLAAAANDPEFAGQFWLEVGGDDALDLLEGGLRRLTDPNGGGFVDPDAANLGLDFGRAIRDSLTAGSTRWTEDEARDFAARMLTGQNWPGDIGVRRGNLAGVGFLFDDAEHHPMGEAFTTATADVFDSWERGEGAPGEVGGSTRLDPMSDGGAFNALVLADQLERGDAYGSNVGDGFGASVLDPMSRVLDTLGSYPNAAWEWLSADGTTLADGSPAMATDKVGYWSSRDWSADGWDGFGSLWDGSLHADGGIAAEGYSQQTWNRMNEVSNQVIAGLSASDGDLRGGTLSEGGGGNLGLALGNLLPLVESQMFLDESVRGAPYITEQIAGVHDGRTIAPFDVNNYGDLVGAATATDSGFANLRTATTNVGNNLILDADAGGSYQTWEQGLGRLANLEAVFSGSVGGEEIMQGRLEDAAIRQRMAIAEGALSFMPGIGGASVAGTVINTAVGSASSYGIGAFTDAMATNEAMAQELATLGGECGSKAFYSKITQLDENEAYSLHDISTDGLTHKQWLMTFEGRFESSYKGRLWDGTDVI